MRTSSGFSLLAIALLVAVLACTVSTAAGKEIRKDYHETFTVAATDRLHLVHGDGDVTITPWDRDELEVTVKYHVDINKVGMGSDPEFEVEFTQDGNTVSVIGKEKSMVTVGYVSSKRYEYLYTIHAPRTLRLDLKGDDGNVEIEEWAGEVECTLEDGDLSLADMQSPRTILNLEDGDLRIDGLTGELEVAVEDGDLHLVRLEDVQCRLELEDGDLFIQDLAGSLVVQTEDGDVDVLRARSEELEIRSGDGSVTVDVLPVDRIDLHVSSGDGDITVELAAGISAKFSIDVDDGRIRMDLPDVQMERDEEDSAAGTIGGGEGRIRLRTEDGRITLRQRG